MNKVIAAFVRLADGRHLAYQEYGDLDGYPILLFHGTPGSRLWFMEDDPCAVELGIRLIALDRPGYGASDPKPNRTLLDWAADVDEVVQKLKLSSYSVLGVSGGGAYAAACAYKKINGLHSTAMVASSVSFQDGKAPASMSRPNRIAFWLSRNVPWLLRSAFRAQIKMMQQNPIRYKKSLIQGNTHLPAADRACLQTDEQAEAILYHMREAHRQGPDEAVRESTLLAKPWSFELKDIQLPVLVFHGDADTMAPYDAVVAAITNAPNCQLHTLHDRGHFLTEDEEVWRLILQRLRDGN